jgi:hypothetical protein
MKKQPAYTKLAALVMGILVASPAFAWLPRSAISSLKGSLYGLYTSADPTCQTGLVATIPLTKTPTAFDFTSGAAIGSGPVSSPINCIVMVAANSSTVAWAAGSYSGQSVFAPGSSTFNDSNCNSNSGSPITGAMCNGSAISWPTQITSDLTALGLTGTTNCTGSASEIIAIYISTDSKCTGIYAVDVANVGTAGNPGITGCTWTSSAPYRPNNLYAPPTASGDTAHGIALCPGSSTCTAPSGTNYKLILDPSYSVGGNGASGCGGLGPPVFGFGTHS